MTQPEFIEPEGVGNLPEADPNEWNDAPEDEHPDPEPPPAAARAFRSLFSTAGDVHAPNHEEGWVIPEGR